MTLMNTLGKTQKALVLIEAGSSISGKAVSKVAAQYLTALYQLAKAAVEKGTMRKQRNFFCGQSGNILITWEKGRLESGQENNLYYLLGGWCRKNWERQRMR